MKYKSTYVQEVPMPRSLNSKPTYKRLDFLQQIGENEQNLNSLRTVVDRWHVGILPTYLVYPLKHNITSYKYENQRQSYRCQTR